MEWVSVVESTTKHGRNFVDRKSAIANSVEASWGGTITVTVGEMGGMTWSAGGAGDIDLSLGLSVCVRENIQFQNAMFIFWQKNNSSRIPCAFGISNLDFAPPYNCFFSWAQGLSAVVRVKVGGDQGGVTEVSLSEPEVQLQPLLSFCCWTMIDSGWAWSMPMLPH